MEHPYLTHQIEIFKFLHSMNMLLSYVLCKNEYKQLFNI